MQQKGVLDRGDMTAKLRQLQKRERVLYKRNPLVEVIAAVRFPPVLSLLQEPPVKFQARFATAYPLAEYVQTMQLAIQPEGGSEEQSVPLTKSYRFDTVDKKWSASVEAGLLALTCRKYSEWSEFRTRFAELFTAFVDIYGVTAVQRTGLRYQDVIQKSALGLDGKTWQELIRPEILGTCRFFTDDLDENPPTKFMIELGIPPGRVRIGINAVRNQAKVPGMLIDTDCYSMDVIEPKSVLVKADELHEYTSAVFQACITDELHAALQREEGV